MAVIKAEGGAPPEVFAPSKGCYRVATGALRQFSTASSASANPRIHVRTATSIGFDETIPVEMIDSYAA